MTLTEAIVKLKKLPIEKLLTTALMSESQHWIYLTLVMSPSDFEPKILLQETASKVEDCNDVYRGVRLDMEELFSDTWCLADPTTGETVEVDL